MPGLQHTQQLAQAANCIYAGRYDEAKALCTQLLKANPKNAKALEMLGQIAHRRGEHRDAARFYQKAIKLQPHDPSLHIHLGASLTMEGRYRDAIARYDRALKIDPGNQIALAAKSGTYIQMDKYDRARTAIEKDLAAERESPEIAASAMRIDIKEKQYDHAIALGRRHLDNPNTHPAHRFTLGIFLGRALERSGSFDEAFAAYDAANDTRPSAVEAENIIAHHDALIEAFSAQRASAGPRSTCRSTAPVFIISMPRSGSTLVERIIGAHPLVHGAGEIDNIHRIVRHLNLTLGSARNYPECIAELLPGHLDQLAETHLAELRALGGNAPHIVNKSIRNRLDLGMIALLYPNAKIIHVRRNPMDSCFSTWAETLSPPAQDFATDQRLIGVMYRQYLRLMDHWRTAFDLDLLEIEYEALVHDQEHHSRRLIDFLELEWDEQCLRYYETKSLSRTLSFEQVRRPIYTSSIGRAAPFAPHLGPLRDALGPELASIEPGSAT